MRALRQHGLAGPHFPQPLARQMRRPLSQMVGDALHKRQVIMVHIAKHRRAWQQRHLGHRFKFGSHPGDPDACIHTFNSGVILSQQPAAKLILLIGQNHPGTAASGMKRRHQACGAASGNQYITMRMRLFIPVRVVMVVRHPAKAGGMANDMFIAHPHRGRPHEGLVIEASRKEARQQRIHRADIEFQRGCAVLALGIQPLKQLNLRGAQIGFGIGTPAKPYQRVRFLRPTPKNSARAVIFE